MSVRVFALLLFCLLALMPSSMAFGQVRTDGDSRRPGSGQEELPANIKETLAKQRIEREKKEYDELLKRTEEAVKLSDELEKAFNDSNKLSGEDRKKLDKLEKLVKKIRSDLGGSDDENDEVEKDNEEDKPNSLIGAFKSLQSNASKLFDEIKRSTRYSISAVAIQSSNVLLKVLKFIRFGN